MFRDLSVPATVHGHSTVLESSFHLETLCCHMGNALVMSVLYLMERDPQHLNCHCSAKSGQELNVHEAQNIFSATKKITSPLIEAHWQDRALLTLFFMYG